MTFERERATMKTLAFVVAAAAAILGLASAETKFGEFNVYQRVKGILRINSSP